MFDFKKERKKEIFIHADPIGNRPSCQNPKVKLTSEFGTRGCSSRPPRGQSYFMCEGLAGDQPKSLQISLCQIQRAAKIIEKVAKGKYVSLCHPGGTHTESVAVHSPV